MKQTTIWLLLLMATNFQIMRSQEEKPRVIISTDIGGDDPDDFQSLIHLLVYTDKLEIEGLISSPPGAGRKKDILKVIDAYQKDYSQLKKHNGKFTDPKILKNKTKQGATKIQEEDIPTTTSEGAKYIISKALENSSQPLWILVWGSITDVAQAIHLEPKIKNRIRIYSIGSWNTRQDLKARNYLFNEHSDLWWIENDHTFRGMYMGGFQKEDYNNTSFVIEHIKEHGALGHLFYKMKKDIKMGDTPSVLYLLSGNSNDPTDSSWGGSFIKNIHGNNYWADNPIDSLKTNNHFGAKTISIHRKLILDDWAKRMALLVD